LNILIKKNIKDKKRMDRNRIPGATVKSIIAVHNFITTFEQFDEAPTNWEIIPISGSRIFQNMSIY
jgi:predicted RNA-binding protein with PUA domain